MASVTHRISVVKQPRKGYLPTSCFSENYLFDGNDIYEVESGVKSIQGLAVDYLTRFMLGFQKEDAFRISLEGASFCSEDTEATSLLSKIVGLDEQSIRSACQLVSYDVAFRLGPSKYTKLDTAVLDDKLIFNIKLLVNRCLNFFGKRGPVKLTGFTFAGGYNEIVDSGDGDYLTDKCLWDLKVSSLPLKKEQTLQILMYYILGLHSIHREFSKIDSIGIYNPLLNIEYTINVNDIDDEIYHNVCKDVIGYNVTDNIHEWRQSSGTNEKLHDQILKDMFFDTGFRPDNYDDGIYEITKDDYWSYYRNISETPYDRPLLPYTDKIKFLKNSGYFMFISVSEGLNESILHGGKLKRLKHPTNYYYNLLPKYGELVLGLFSNYWNRLFDISDKLTSIKPDIEYVKKHQYGDYKRECKFYNRTPMPFEKWYELEKDDLTFSGYVHGCIVNLDYSNHIYLNPYDGTVAAYTASSIYDKNVYDNTMSLIAAQRPEMLNGYKVLSTDSTAENETFVNNVDTKALTTVCYDIVPMGTDVITNNTTKVTSTAMYDVSNKLKGLQLIYTDGLVVDWYDNLIPVNLIEAGIQAAKSLRGHSLEMKSGEIGTVIEDNGENDITVRFENGEIIEHISRKKFKGRNLASAAKKEGDKQSNKKSYVGKRQRMNCGYFATVIEDFGCNDITVQFEDGLIRKHCRRDKFREGKIGHSIDRAGSIIEKKENEIPTKNRRNVEDVPTSKTKIDYSSLNLLMSISEHKNNKMQLSYTLKSILYGSSFIKIDKMNFVWDNCEECGRLVPFYELSDGICEKCKK